MATYVIGDIQGCYQELQQLLNLIHFDPDKDVLWATGDLVNRGPQSLEVLRFFKQLGDRAVTVLGNHDLHLLALSVGIEKHKHETDTLQTVLDAPDSDELMTWLRYRPFLYYDEQFAYTLIHAGLPPQWDLFAAREYAHELEMALRSDNYIDFLRGLYYAEKSNLWSNSLKGHQRLRFITQCLTRLRYCTVDGKLALKQKGSLEENLDQNILPWFKHPKRLTTQDKIIFGHWATLGFYNENNVYGLDTGCVWGGQLTALRLEDKQRFSLSCQGILKPTL